MNRVTELYGSMVFSDTVMQDRLPRETWKALQAAQQYGQRLTPEAASVVASAMKDWAIEKGATHYTHWFQPMTGITAEKHDGFLSPSSGGRAIMEFSGRELIHGEPDASSFPSGGLRATFEARGYTAWDPTSYAFVKDGVLCIPTAFCSYGSEALDKKTPLLRSMDALNKQALRIVRLFGDTVTAVVRPTVGAEQEYFLIDRAVYERRKDLMYTGRTLFGSKPPKGQDLDDHYFGAIKTRIADFMRDLDRELWMLGIPAKTEHNEAAPAQHELAVVYTTVNLACDHNQLVMERMKRVAENHGMVCLLHEKPFAGVNGSGKHNNWSLATDKGENLLEPGETPAENAQFLLFLCAVLQAVNEYQELLRSSIASAGNDHRLGAAEAPPAILSVYLGEELTAILDAIDEGAAYVPGEKVQFKVGVDVLPRFPKDSTDRNRTSPFAFTGNKFEFRMVGSSASISGANICLNAAVTDVLRRYADRLEAAADFETELHDLIQDAIRENRRIIFNGNGYDEAWAREARERGLSNLPTTPDCLPHMLDEKNIRMYETTGVFTETEVRARYEILMENYCKLVKIEAQTMLDMVWKDILPAVSAFVGKEVAIIRDKKAVCESIDCRYEETVVNRLSTLTGRTCDMIRMLEEAVNHSADSSLEAFANRCRDEILPRMEALRLCVDEMENWTGKEYWPYPSYGDLLFSVH